MILLMENYRMSNIDYIKENMKAIQGFIIVAVFGILISCQNHGTSPDNEYDVTVKEPKLAGLKTRIFFDEAHKNHHEIERTYKPFAALLRNDGCIITAARKPIVKPVLEEAEIYVIATAMGKEEPGEKSPFTDSEINTLEEWVRNGGSALIVTEHYPFGLAMQSLLKKFGVTVHNGYTEDSTLTNKDVRDALLFEKSNGSLNDNHSITSNVDRVNTFTGSSVKGDSTWMPLLIFTDNAQNYNVDVKVNKDGGDVNVNIAYADFYSAKGYAQGICKIYGKGKIVVLAESAMLTAQIDKNGNKFGMNIPNADNKEFTLNIFRWLANR